jgi:DNA-binding HxlR family transcriptional regulator
MLKRDYEGQLCAIAKSLEIVGERWTLLIIRDAFLGKRRFDEFQESLGVARNVLTDRLTRLVDEGIFERVLYNERPPRYEYRLTPKGRGLNVALTALRQWGEEHVDDAQTRILRRRSDGAHLVAAIVPVGTDVVEPRDIELVRSD